MFLTYFFLNLIKIWSFTFDYRASWFILIYPFWCQFSAFFYHAGFINTIYNWSFEKLLVISYNSTTKYLDKGIFELFGPYGLYKGFHFIYYALKFSWLSSISIAIFIMFTGICLIFLYSYLIITSLFLVIIKYVGLLFISLIILIYLNN